MLKFNLSPCPFCDKEVKELCCPNPYCIGSTFISPRPTLEDKQLDWNHFCVNQKRQIRFMANFISNIWTLK
jgi:hypothetical protein